MYVYDTITLLSGSLYSTNTSTNIIIINIHSVEFYFQWQLSQYSDSIEAGPHVVCFLAEARDILSISRTSDQSWGPSGLLFSGCCGSFPSVEAADAWGWSLSCVFCWGYTSVQLWFPCMSSLCTQGQFCLLLLFWSNDFNIYLHIILSRRKWGWYVVMEQCSYSAVLRCFKTQNGVIWWSVSNRNDWKLLCMWLFLLCNAHLLTIYVAFSCALAFQSLFGLIEISSLCFLKFRECDVL